MLLWKLNSKKNLFSKPTKTNKNRGGVAGAAGMFVPLAPRRCCGQARAERGRMSPRRRMGGNMW